MRNGLVALTPMLNTRVFIARWKDYESHPDDRGDACNPSSQLLRDLAPPPDGDGAVRVMRNALRDAGLQPHEIEYINAHGTSTDVGDRAEAAAIKRCFGDHAYKVAVSSTKSMTGHLLGGAGGLEAGLTVLAIRDQVAPPTVNYETPDPDCDLDFVPNHARPMRIDHALSNSFGFGGTNGALIFKRYME